MKRPCSNSATSSTLCVLLAMLVTLTPALHGCVTQKDIAQQEDPVEQAIDQIWRATLLVLEEEGYVIVSKSKQRLRVTTDWRGDDKLQKMMSIVLQGSHMGLAIRARLQLAKPAPETPAKDAHKVVINDTTWIIDTSSGTRALAGKEQERIVGLIAQRAKAIRRAER